MSDYEYEGETFKLDDSKGCYVEVTYKDLTGYFGVNIKDNATDQDPYLYWGEGERYATPDGMRNGRQSSSFEEALDQTCSVLLNRIRIQEGAKTFDRAKYCKELHDAVKNLP